jgi:hypothetical protein
MKVGFKYLVVLGCSFIVFTSFGQNNASFNVTFYSNGYTYPSPLEADTLITTNGLSSWSDHNRKSSLYFYVTAPTKVKCFLQLREVISTSQLSIKLDGKGKEKLIPIAKGALKIFIGDFELLDTGYHYFEIKGASKSKVNYPSIESIVIETPQPKSIQFNTSNYRGAASTHLRYSVPGDSAIKWFYTEVTVPNEVKKSINAYYETNGFHSGYGGIQINSPSERRFIFSIWSLFKTDDPKQIPAEYIVHLNKKGKDVFTGDFGDEGSGGHSHLVFPWQTNQTYRFLTGIVGLKGDSATYVGYFAGPEDQYQWHLLSKWTQHKTDTKTGFKNLYAFVENFGENGNDFFKAYYGNQWAITFNGNWIELTEAKFTTTANNKTHQRFDYGAGEEAGKFYMFSGGFKQMRNIMPGGIIKRKPTGIHININFEELAK